jgi:hypothetical protein
LRLHRAKDHLRPADAIHFVDREHDVADAEHGKNHGVTLGLARDAFVGADQEEREIGDRSAGRHVGGVLLVARRIDDDELAARRGEEAVSHVDGDFLLAFSGEAVQQQGKIEIFTLRAELARVLDESGELIFEQLLRFVQQAANQRRLAVID